MPTTEDHTLTLNGWRAHYRDWPNPGAPALLILHAFSQHARAWDTVAAALQAHYRVLVLDWRGHGESAWAPDYSSDRWREDIASFVDALDLPTFTLLGHSIGGRQGYAYAAQHPERVERLVLIDIGPDGAPGGAAYVHAVVRGPDVFDSVAEAIAAVRPLFPYAPRDAMEHLVRHNLMPHASGGLTWRYDPLLRSPDVPRLVPTPAEQWEMLPKLACAALLVHGAESWVLTRETAERMARLIPNCRLVEVPRAGHTVHLDNPPAFLAAVESFLELG
jgi:pimeloyl-ACP methyl ester carboxylesterase